MSRAPAALDKRRACLRLAGAAALQGVARASAARPARVELRTCTLLPAAHPLNLRLLQADRRLRELSGGRLGLRLFPNSLLGNADSMLAQLRMGAIDLYAISPMFLADLVPATALSGVCYAFDDYAGVWKAMDGELGDLMRARIRQAGLEVMRRCWDSGFRQVTSQPRPVRSAVDLQGLRIRVPPVDLLLRGFEAMRARPTVLQIADLYPSLQSGLLQAQENPLVIVSTFALYEVQRYCSLTRHAWDGFWMLAHPGSLRRLGPQLRTLLAEQLDQAALRERDDVARLDRSLQRELIAQGMRFNTPPTQGFRDLLRDSGYYEACRARFGSADWDVLERNTRRLA